MPIGAPAAIRARSKGVPHMNDLIYVAMSVAFFVIAAAYVIFCGKVR